MAWRALTADDVLAVLNNTEANAYRTKLLASGQADPITGLIEQVTREIRASIRSCRENTLSDDDDQIPEDAIDVACILVRHKLQNRYTIAITEDRREEWREAKRWLREVRACQVKIEQPDGDPETKAVSRKPRITSPTLTHEREDADGI